MVTPEELEEIEHISMEDVRQHYDDRVEIHNSLIKLLKNEDEKGYVNLALGINDLRGNYSANEHKLGPKILSENTPHNVFRLAKKIYACQSVSHIPQIIYKSNLPYLKIGVGSEMATMLKPEKFWVGNVRTIWTHLLIKHMWDYDKADEELELYRNDDISSEMAYQIWRDIYLSMEPNLITLMKIGNEYASINGVKIGELKYLWADAIANALYEYEDE